MQKFALKFDNFKVIGAAIFILALAAFFRGIDLDHTGYWLDEMSSVHYSTSPHLDALFWDNSPPLYHFILRFWIDLFGTGEVATRSLSGLFSICCTLLWLRWGYRKRGLFGVMVCGGLHALFAVSIFLGRETRMYSLFELTSTWLWLAFLDVEEGVHVSLTRKILAALAAMLSHLLAIVPFGLGALFLGDKIKARFFARRELMIFAAVGLVALASLTFLRTADLGWQLFKFQVEASSRWPGGLLLELFGGWLGLLGASALFALGIYYRIRQVKSMAICILAALFLSELFVWLSERAFFISRYFVYLIPLIIASLSLVVFCSMAEPAETLLAKRLRLAAVLSLLLFMSGQWLKANDFLALENPGWREAAQIVREYSKDPIMFTTRPLSMRSPYFDNPDIPFTKLVLNSAEPFAPLQKACVEHRDVWVIESYWGIKVYRELLKEFIARNGLQFFDDSVVKPNIESVFLLKLICN